MIIHVDLHGTLVPPEYGALVAKCLKYGESRLRAVDGLALPAEVYQLIAVMESWHRAAADVAYAEPSLPPPLPLETSPLEWITAKEAAVILDVCERRARTLCLRLPSARKTKGGVWRVLRDDVLEEADARAEARAAA